MKNGKNPTLAQKKMLKIHGLLPESWLIVKDTAEMMEVVSREELKQCRIPRIQGRAKPRTRKLKKEIV